ncbi:MAG: helix-turn-helix domain-containing protein [Thermoplasmata archaeon]|nr:helix-turn-helix domain-containing protein [Thermoplasmata archaeon]
MQEDLLALKSRRTIYSHISGNPGTYLREMETSLGLSVGDLQYHLGQLEKAGMIRAYDDGRRKGYFVASEVQYLDRQMISIIRMRTPRRIIIFLLMHPEASFQEILAEFNFTKGALSFHLKRLLKTEVLTKAKRERESIFSVAEPEKMKNLLVTYRASISDEVLDNVVDIFARI